MPRGGEKRCSAENWLSFTAPVVATRGDFMKEIASFGPDIFLSDFPFRASPGEEARKISQQRCRQVPVIMWAGMLGDETAVKLIMQGATG